MTYLITLIIWYVGLYSGIQSNLGVCIFGTGDIRNTTGNALGSRRLIDHRPSNRIGTHVARM
jgi:hypothetical protein